VSSSPVAQPSSRRLDQWLWVARFVKSRSLASRLCMAGAVTLNGVMVRKASHAIRVGDIVVVPQGVLLRTIRVKALGWRRGPPSEARLLYDETAAPVNVRELTPSWKRLLDEGEITIAQPSAPSPERKLESSNMGIVIEPQRLFT
jgi:ribosome-associated heat shock protein Hsp15